MLWTELSDETKQDICRQLRDILTTMRSAKPTTNVIGSVSGGDVQDCRRIMSYSCSPCPDEQTFNEFILDLKDSAPTAIRRAFHSQLRTDHRIVFTHGDINLHNIMVQDGKITGIIDWEFAGWYPEHWEYVKFFERPTTHKDWYQYADRIFPQAYDQELVLYQAVNRWQQD